MPNVALNTASHHIDLEWLLSTHPKERTGSPEYGTLDRAERAHQKPLCYNSHK